MRRAPKVTAEHDQGPSLWGAGGTALQEGPALQPQAASGPGDRLMLPRLAVTAVPPNASLLTYHERGTVWGAGLTICQGDLWTGPRESGFRCGGWVVSGNQNEGKCLVPSVGFPARKWGSLALDCSWRHRAAFSRALCQVSTLGAVSTSHQVPGPLSKLVERRDPVTSSFLLSVRLHRPYVLSPVADGLTLSLRQQTSPLASAAPKILLTIRILASPHTSHKWGCHRGKCHA